MNDNGAVAIKNPIISYILHPSMLLLPICLGKKGKRHGFCQLFEDCCCLRREGPGKISDDSPRGEKKRGEVGRSCFFAVEIWEICNMTFEVKFVQ